MPARKYNITFDLFQRQLTSYSAYILGLIWSDGWVCSNVNDSKFGEIRFISTYPDADHFSKILSKTGTWGEYRSATSGKDRYTAYVRNLKFAELLIQNDYGSKTTVSADKILSTIPETLRRFFFLGVVDGDGCFSMTPTRRGYFNRRFSVASSYEQDWSYFENELNRLGVNYKIERYKNSTSSFSKIHVSAVDDIDRLGTFLYRTQDVDHIGLDRKYSTFREICSTGRRKTSKYKRVLKKGSKWKAYSSQANGQRCKWLGTFNTEEDAARAAGTF